MKFKNYLRSSFTKVSQHNHTVANEQKEGDQMQFSLEKRLEKRK